MKVLGKSQSSQSDRSPARPTLERFIVQLILLALRPIALQGAYRRPDKRKLAQVTESLGTEIKEEKEGGMGRLID